MRSEKARFFAAIVAAAVCIMLIASAFASAAETEQVVQITAKRFEFSPQNITVKRGVPVVLEFTSLDRLHGFSCSGLGIRSDIPPKKVTKLQFVPQKPGTFPFHCDIFCEGGHEGMTGTIIVKE